MSFAKERTGDLFAMQEQVTRRSRVSYETVDAQRNEFAAMEEIPTVFVVDDDAETREQVSALAESLGFVAEAYADASSFLRAFRFGSVGCLVLDARLEGMSSEELRRELADRKILIPVIVTTGYVDTRMIIDTIRGGAFDVVEKPFKPERLAESVRNAVDRHVELLKSQEESQEIRRRYAHLTPRERQVLELVVSGLSTKAIAIRLGLQEKTIEAYRWRIKGTMEARNAADLVRLINQINNES